MPNYNRIEQIQQLALKEVSTEHFFSWLYQNFSKSMVAMTEQELDTVEEAIKQGVCKEEVFIKNNLIFWR